MSAAESNDVIGVISEAITWVLVIVGWMIVSDQQENREVAKTGYARINNVRESLREIEQQAIQFHTSTFQKNAMHALMRSIDRASREMTHLRKHGFIGIGTSERMGEVRKAITIKNFDGGNHVELEAGSKILLGIEAACGKLDRELLDSAHNVTSSPRTLRASIATVLRRRI